MTAGSGVLHQEYHEENWAKNGGTFQMVQMWMNLPAKDREVKPQYQDLLFDEMTRVNLENNGGFVNVIAGEYKGNKGKGTTFSPINLFNVYLNNGGKTDFEFPNTYNTAFLVINGDVLVNGTENVSKDSFAMLENDNGDMFTLEATSNHTIILVMSGEPLNEPIAHYGPFVMNTQEQLKTTFEEFKAGKFGTL